MLESLRPTVLRMLRVPPEPSAPEGTALRVFRASPAYLRYRLILWSFAQLGALIGLIGGLVAIAYFHPVVQHPILSFGLRAAEALAWITFLVQLPFSLLLLRLDFDLRWYILSDRSLRIREGILTVREKTMTFANIQQISIQQNPIQRLLRISDVLVRTAGGGSGGGSSGHQQVGESMHEAYFRGVDDGEEIRRAIQERVRLHRDAGLGDPEDPRDEAGGMVTGKSAGALDAARELLGEVRGLRHALSAARR